LDRESIADGQSVLGTMQYKLIPDMLFERYVGIDYSGAETPISGLEHIP
jgi:hypothetical protein